MRKRFFVAALITLSLQAEAQQKQDTVIVELGKSSKVIFTVQDRADLEVLKHYNFQDLFQDIISKLEKQDTSNSLPKSDTTSAPVVADSDEAEWRTEHEQNDSDNSSDGTSEEWDVNVGNRNWGRTWQSFNFDLGTNNYLNKGKFPDSENALYAVRPWGSWYFAASSIQRTRLGRKFFLEWGLGLSWYNFKFQKDNILIVKDASGVQFVEDTRDATAGADFIKSKLSMSFIQASLVPVIDFGDHSRKPRFWDGYGNSFRVGFGPYIGYKISSHSKLVYKDDDGREKEKNHDSFYINNIRYGARLQIGYRSTDLFFNYDLNELFSANKGPKLNAFSFGIIF
jgi:hypothetical protein